MDGLPKTTDFSPLIGRTIEMLRIGKYYAHYLFNDDKPKKPDVWIEIESSKLIFTDVHDKSTDINDFRIGGGLLCLLLGLSVKKAFRRDDGGLTLEMSDGTRLEIAIHTSTYEAVVLHIGEDVYVG